MLLGEEVREIVVRALVYEDQLDVEVSETEIDRVVRQGYPG